MASTEKATGLTLQWRHGQFGSSSVYYRHQCPIENVDFGKVWRTLVHQCQKNCLCFKSIGYFEIHKSTINDMLRVKFDPTIAVTCFQSCLVVFLLTITKVQIRSSFLGVFFRYFCYLAIYLFLKECLIVLIQRFIQIVQHTH